MGLPALRPDFANRNQTHTCRRLGDLDRHFAGKDPAVRAAFDAVLAAVAGLGPVEVLAESSRIALHLRMSFAAFVARRHWLDGHVVLARRLDSPRFRRIEEYSPRNVLHAFRLHGPDDVDAEVGGLAGGGLPGRPPGPPAPVGRHGRLTSRA